MQIDSCIRVNPCHAEFIFGNLFLALVLQQVKDTNVVGQYDAVVVHADNGAIEFFERYGFTPDIVINSKWR